MTTLNEVLSAKAKMDAMNTMLEALIDLHGLHTILAQLREICYAKANTIAVRDQDVAVAKQWIAYGIRCNQVAQACARSAV